MTDERSYKIDNYGSPAACRCFKHRWDRTVRRVRCYRMGHEWCADGNAEWASRRCLRCFRVERWRWVDGRSSSERVR